VSHSLLAVIGAGLEMDIAAAAEFLCIVYVGSCFVVFICPGLLPTQVLGQSSGRATIHQLLQIICEEIPWATNFVSGEAVV